MNETTRAVTSGANNSTTGGIPLEVSLGDNWTLTESKETLSISKEGCDQDVNNSVVIYSDCGPWNLTDYESNLPHDTIHTAIDLTGVKLDVYNEAEPDATSPTMFSMMFILEQEVNDTVGTSMQINGNLNVYTLFGLPVYWEYDDDNGLTGERPLIRYSIKGVADFDNDGVMNFYDICPETDAKELSDENGCSWEQYDDDDDDVLNGLDRCPDTTTKSVDANGCAEYQKDDDDDGVMNNVDTCPGTLAGESVDTEGCSDRQKVEKDDLLAGQCTCPDGSKGQMVGPADDDGVDDGCLCAISEEDSSLPSISLIPALITIGIIALRRRY